MYLLYLHEVPGRGRICTDMTAEREDNQIQAHAAFQCVIHALFTSVITAIITTLIVMGAMGELNSFHCCQISCSLFNFREMCVERQQYK